MTVFLVILGLFILWWAFLLIYRPRHRRNMMRREVTKDRKRWALRSEVEAELDAKEEAGRRKRQGL